MEANLPKTVFGATAIPTGTWPALADKEKTNRWVSHYAAYVLKKAVRQI
jgi:hypothetical protein